MPLWLALFYDIAQTFTAALLVTFPVHVYFLCVILPLYAACSAAMMSIASLGGME